MIRLQNSRANPICPSGLLPGLTWSSGLRAGMPRGCSVLPTATASLGRESGEAEGAHSCGDAAGCQGCCRVRAASPGCCRELLANGTAKGPGGAGKGLEGLEKARSWMERAQRGWKRPAPLLSPPRSSSTELTAALPAQPPGLAPGSAPSLLQPGMLLTEIQRPSLGSSAHR